MAPGPDWCIELGTMWDPGWISNCWFCSPKNKCWADEGYIEKMDKIEKNYLGGLMYIYRDNYIYIVIVIYIYI